jgi:hypothetical protein
MKQPFPTPCPLWAEKLAATHPDDLTLAERQELQAHLASCRTCSAIRAEYEVMGQAISQLPTVNPDPGLPPRLLHLLNAQANHTTWIPPTPGSLPYVPTYPSMPSLSARNGRKEQMRTAVSTLAAVLVVAALLGSFLVLFTSHRTGTGHPGNTGTWHIIPSVNPGSMNNALLSVTALSASDAWAVGFTSNTPISGASQTLIEHWNGSQWSVVRSPNSTLAHNALNGVVALSTNDVWAVGYSFLTPSDGAYQPLVEHWNGSQWSIFKMPEQRPGMRSSTFSRLIVLSDNNIWGMGTSTESDGHYSATLIEHWNGTAWSIIPSPNPGLARNELRGAVALSANDIWAVGLSANGNSDTLAQTLIEHWNGTAWSIVPTPRVGSSDNFLNAATAVSANNIWAVGVSSNSSSTFMGQTLIEHWNGNAWSIVKSPSAGPEENFDSMTAIAANDIWAVGVSSNSSSADATQGLTLHWDGIQWSAVKSPNPGQNTLLSGIARIPGSRGVWTVGYYSYPSDKKVSTFTALYS